MAPPSEVAIVALNGALNAAQIEALIAAAAAAQVATRVVPIAARLEAEVGTHAVQISVQIWARIGVQISARFLVQIWVQTAAHESHRGLPVPHVVLRVVPPPPALA